MQIIFFDDETRDHLLPLAFTRPVAAFRMGINTLAESWSQLLGAPHCYFPHASLRETHPTVCTDDNLFINGRFIPSSAYRQDLIELRINTALVTSNTVLAARCSRSTAEQWLASGTMPASVAHARTEQPTSDHVEGHHSSSPAPSLIASLPDVFMLNEAKLNEDFRLITHGRISAAIDPTCVVLGDPGRVFIEPGAVVEACYLNTRLGPIYIGADAQVEEGSVLKGPLAILDNAVVKAGARIGAATTIGPHCKVGGEVSNTVFFGYSNKSHDGFIGNSVIGEWCNFGADTNCSNLKNNYSEVSIYDYVNQRLEPTGLTFCGLFMGDHSKCGINTMFNTGTSVGVSANIFGGGFPSKFIPSFSWGGSDGFEQYHIEKAIQTAQAVMKRRNASLSAPMERVLRNLHRTLS
jgi:UDP-N-acetylglucosamine diphosphorylase/glucosamine-1-phosphate N-acetyltransferase